MRREEKRRTSTEWKRASGRMATNANGAGSEYGVLTASFLHARAPGHAPVHKYPSRRMRIRPISLFGLPLPACLALFVSRLRHSMGSSWEVSGGARGGGPCGAPLRVGEKTAQVLHNHARLSRADSALRRAAADPKKAHSDCEREKSSAAARASGVGWRVGGNVRSVWKRASDLVKWFV